MPNSDLTKAPDLTNSPRHGRLGVWVFVTALLTVDNQIGENVAVERLVAALGGDWSTAALPAPGSLRSGDAGSLRSPRGNPRPWAVFTTRYSLTGYSGGRTG